MQQIKEKITFFAPCLYNFCMQKYSREATVYNCVGYTDCNDKKTATSRANGVSKVNELK